MSAFNQPHRWGFGWTMVVCMGVSALSSLGSRPALAAESTRIVDHSLLIAPEYPCTWPAEPFPRFQMVAQRTIGPDSAYNVDTLMIDGNTGTQLDVPPHSVARPELKRDKSGPGGLAYTDRIEAWQFGGEACVVDVRDLLDQAEPGVSPLIRAAHVQQFEQQHRPLRLGDVVLFRSDYSDRYYRPWPEGRRYIADVLDRRAVGYPDPDPDCMEYLASRQVKALGTDSASMGPLPDLAEPTHYAGLKHGMVWTESATRLGELPNTGAFYCILCPKHQNGPYSEGRALSWIGGDLPRRLIDAARQRRVIDLSPTLAPELPVTNPGASTAEHRQTYVKVDFLYSEYLDMWHHAHWMDSMAGTHLVPPAYALPPPDRPVQYAPEVRGWLQTFEQQFGPRGTSTRTADQVPLDWTCGKPRVIDVRSLIGSVPRRQWPSSPVITVQQLESYEAKEGPLLAGEIVILHTGHCDRYLQPKPHHGGLWSDPLQGKAEGWPALGPEAIEFLHQRGIRCIATDAPDLGGVDPQHALRTYWALGGRDMVGIEFLINVGQIPRHGYFVFAPLKIRDCHGGPGRALVFYDP